LKSNPLILVSKAIAIYCVFLCIMSHLQSGDIEGIHLHTEN